MIENVVRLIVLKKLKHTLSNEIQTIMNAAIETTLDEVKKNLLIKLIQKDNVTFSVEFDWRKFEP